MIGLLINNEYICYFCKKQEMAIALAIVKILNFRINFY